MHRVNGLFSEKMSVAISSSSCAHQNSKSHSHKQRWLIIDIFLYSEHFSHTNCLNPLGCHWWHTPSLYLPLTLRAEVFSVQAHHRNQPQSVNSYDIHHSETHWSHFTFQFDHFLSFLKIWTLLTGLTQRKTETLSLWLLSFVSFELADEHNR